MSDLKKILKEEYDKKKLNITPKLLMEMIEQVMFEEKNSKVSLVEAQTGTMFEDVLVQVAKFGSEAVKSDPRANVKPPSLRNKKKNKYNNYTMLQLSIEALKRMGWDEDEIKGKEGIGVDKDATVFSTKGMRIAGSPKTDVVIKNKEGTPWRISLKLPVDVQLGGAGAETSIDIFKKTFEAYKKEKKDEAKVFKDNLENLEDDLENEAKDEAQTLLQDQLNDLTGFLIESGGTFFNTENYVDTLTKNILKSEKKMRRFGLENEESVRAFAEQKAQEFRNKGHQAWETWNRNVKENAVRALKEFITSNDDFFVFIVDEYLTGRRQFAKNETAAANALLSPSLFHSLETMEDTKKLMNADNGAFRESVSSDIRARGRPFLAKQVSVKIEVKDAVYQKLREAAVMRMKCGQSPSNDAEQLNEVESKCQTVESVASSLVDDLNIQIDLDGDEPEKET